MISLLQHARRIPPQFASFPPTSTKSNQRISYLLPGSCRNLYGVPTGKLYSRPAVGSNVSPNHTHTHNTDHNDINGMRNESKKPDDEGTRITLLGLGSNVALTAGKGAGGLFLGSASLIADAVHSLSDLVSDGVALAAYKKARMKKDELYPYGHGKLEPLGSLTISSLLLAAGIATGIHSVDVLQELLSVSSNSEALSQAQSVFGLHTLSDPKVAAFAVSLAAASIAVKEALFRWTLHIGTKQNSSILIANAWHHRADSASGLVALGGVAGAYFGYTWMDPVGGLLVSGMIVQTSLQMIGPTLRELRDGAHVQVVTSVQTILDRMKSQDKNISAFHSIRARKMGPETLVDLQVQVNPRITVSLAHQIAENARYAIMREVPGVSEVLIHVDVDAPDHNSAPPTATVLPTSHIEDDIMKRALRGLELEVNRFTHFKVHYLNGAMEIDAGILLQDASSLSFHDAIEISFKVRDRLLAYPGVAAADVHLETDPNHFHSRETDSTGVSKLWRRNSSAV
ncbi:cation efflux family-domain-containing protein [Obelidium mucronatum]|nr:cation efflux family-domain-containing protein [Obelidium mucronatum]